MCVCFCKCNVCECYSAVLVIRLAYTSTKACVKMNGMTTVNTFIHYQSLSCARWRVMHFPSAFNSIISYVSPFDATDSHSILHNVCKA